MCETMGMVRVPVEAHHAYKAGVPFQSRNARWNDIRSYKISLSYSAMLAGLIDFQQDDANLRL